MLDFQ